MQILGIAVFGVGVSTIVSQKTIHALHIPGITSLPAWMISIGLFLCILSAVGGIGSFYYRRSFLIVVKSPNNNNNNNNNLISYTYKYYIYIYSLDLSWD